jgi:hypothetical protein
MFKIVSSADLTVSLVIQIQSVFIWKIDFFSFWRKFQEKNSQICPKMWEISLFLCEDFMPNTRNGHSFPFIAHNLFSMLIHYMQSKSISFYNLFYDKSFENLKIQALLLNHQMELQEDKELRSTSTSTWGYLSIQSTNKWVEK